MPNPSAIVTERYGLPTAPDSRAVISNRAGLPGSGTPASAPRGASRRSIVAGDPCARSGRIAATPVACRASRASSCAVPEFGRPIVDRRTGVAPVTPCALVSVVTWSAGSGAAGGRFTRRSAPVVKLAWSWTDRCQVLHPPTAITLVATASTASSTGPAWRTGRRLICQAATAAVRSRPRTAARSPIRATAGSSRSISTAAAASASTGAVTRIGSTPMEPSTPTVTGAW